MQGPPSRVTRGVLAVLCVLALVLLLAPSMPVRSLIPPQCGPITTPTTWRIIDSPVTVKCNVIVRGVSLTIEAGVRVEMDAGVSIFVENSGSLSAVGARGNMIVFTNPNAVATPWNTIQINASATGRVSFASLAHGNRTLASDGSSPRFDNNTADSAIFAVYLRFSGATVENNTLSNATYGVYAEQSAARIWYNGVSRARFGIHATGGTSAWIIGNTVSTSFGPQGSDGGLPGMRGGNGGTAFGIVAQDVTDAIVTGNKVDAVQGGRGGNGAANAGGAGGAGGTGGDGVGIGVANVANAVIESNRLTNIRGARGGNGASGAGGGGAGGDGGNAYPLEILSTGSTLVTGTTIDVATGGAGGDGGIGSGPTKNGPGGAGRDAVGIFALGAGSASVWSSVVSRITGGNGGNSSIVSGSPGPGGRGGAGSGAFGFGVPVFHDWEFNSFATIAGGNGGRGQAGGIGGNATGLAVLGNTQFLNFTFLVSNTVDTVTGGVGGLGTFVGGAGGAGAGEAVVAVDLSSSGEFLTQIRGGNGGAATAAGGRGGDATGFATIFVPSGQVDWMSLTGVTPGTPATGGLPGTSIGMYAAGASSVRTSVRLVNATLSSVTGYDFVVDNYALVVALNVGWNAAQLGMAPAGNLTIQNFLDLEAVWPDGVTPAAGARFSVRDNGVEVHNVTADSTGWALWRVVTDRRYIGSTTATENTTTASASYPFETFTNSPRSVDMSTSHPEVFVMADTVPPTSTLGALSTYTTTVTLSISFSSSDGSGVGVTKVSLYYGVNGGPWTLYANSSAPSGIFLFDTSTTGGDGLYQFTSVATDGANNVEPGPAANKTWTVVDTTRPLSHVNPLPAYETVLSFTVEWRAEEISPDVNSFAIQVRDNGGSWVDWLANTHATSGIYTGVDGHRYEFRSIATDNAGNVEIPPPGNDTWTIVDVSAPRSSVATLPVYETALTFTLSWSPTGGTTDIATYTVRVSDNGGGWTTLVSGTTSTSMLFTGQDGHAYAFRSIARDRAGNLEAKSGNDTWTITDATPPTIAVFAPSGTGIGTTAPIVITFSEPMNAAATEAAVSFTPTATGAYSWNANQTVLTFVAYSPLAGQTQYTVVISSGARDRAGNALNQRVFQFTTGAALPAGPAIGDFWWIFLLIAGAVIGGLFLALRMRRPGPTAPPAAAAAKRKEESTIEDVFLLYRDGVLIKHQTRRLKPDIDSDILSGMLTAVQAFVKDSFRGEAEGELDEMKFGEMRIMIGRGRYVILAAIATGDDTMTMKGQIHECIREIEDRHWDQLEDWNGDLAFARDLDPYVKKLIRGEYEYE